MTEPLEFLPMGCAFPEPLQRHSVLLSRMKTLLQNINIFPEE